MHVDRLYHATCDLVSAHVYTATHLVRVGGGRVYEIKTLHINLAPEEGEGRLFKGAYNRASTVHVHHDHTVYMCICTHLAGKSSAILSTNFSGNCVLM